jgi:hypothetical protein
MIKIGIGAVANFVGCFAIRSGYDPTHMATAFRFVFRRNNGGYRFCVTRLHDECIQIILTAAYRVLLAQ